MRPSTCKWKPHFEPIEATAAALQHLSNSGAWLARKVVSVSLVRAEEGESSYEWLVRPGLQNLGEMKVYRRICLVGDQFILTSTSDDKPRCRLADHYLDFQDGYLVFRSGQRPPSKDIRVLPASNVSLVRRKVVEWRVRLAHKAACKRSLRTQRHLSSTVSFMPASLMAVRETAERLGYSSPGISLMQQWNTHLQRSEWAPMVCDMEVYRTVPDLMLVLNAEIPIVVFSDDGSQRTEASLDGSYLDGHATASGAGLMLSHDECSWEHKGPWINEDGDFGEWPR